MSIIHRPNAVQLMDAEANAVVFSDEQRASLEQQVHLVCPRLDATTWRQHRRELASVEIAFTGWGAPVLDRELLDAMPRLRAVFHVAGSVKFMLSDEFWNRNIRVTSAASVNAIPVVEFSFAEIILSLKRAWSSARATRDRRQFVREDHLVPSCLGSTVGLISLGFIGKSVAARLASLEVHVIAYDPHIDPCEAAKLGVRLCDLDELFRTSHVVSCHAPLLPATTDLIRGAHLRSLRSGATFINTARGKIVNNAELAEVLRERPDLFAVLDVTDPEPPPPDYPLFDLPNVFITPHISGSIGPECKRMGALMCAELKRYLHDGTLASEIHRPALAHTA